MKRRNKQEVPNILEIEGLGQRSFLKSVDWPFPQSLISVRKSFFLPIFVLTPYSDPVDFFKRMSVKSRVRQNLLRITKTPKLLFPANRMKFKLVYSLPLNKSQMHQSNPWSAGIEDAYISREVARSGFLMNRMDNTLEYDLIRNWEKYDVLFTRARMRIAGRIWPTRNTQPKKQNLDLNRILDECLPDNYLSSQLLRTTSLVQTQGQRLFFVGSVYLALHNGLSDSYMQNWELMEIEEAQVLHGKIAYSKGKFYSGDNSKIPTFGSSFNAWPGYLYQREDSAYISEVVQSNSDFLQKGLLIGGTKNWMHFVIEDLPRVLLFDQFIEDKSIPLLVSSELGSQILDSIRALSRRPIIQLAPQSRLQVHKLYLLQFNNPLRLTMAGDRKASTVLFERKLLIQAREWLRAKDAGVNSSRRRILIKRERGLFRPLINASKLQSILESRYGFSSFYLSDLGLREVQNIFSNAELIVGEYGAGLANLILASNDCKIIEIRGGLESGSKEYQLLSEALGLDHSVLVGTNRLFSRFGIARGPYSINIRSVSNLLESKLNSGV